MGIFSTFFSKKEERAILSAAKKGDLVKLQSLLDSNSVLDLVNAKTSMLGKTPLHLAAENGHKQIVELLIAKGANVNATEREMTNTPLHLAALIGHTQIAELLLSNGAGVNARNKNGSSPLREAIIWGRMEMVKFLIAKGADVNTKDSDGEPVLVLASKALPGAPSASHDYGFSGPSFDIIGDQKHRKEIAELLITKGADVNTKDITGITPLYRIASNGQREVAELLLAKGADVNAKTNNGFTPLHVGAQNGHKEVVELLIAKGANVNAKNDDGTTPLVLGKQNNHIVELLLKHGGNK